MSRLSSFLFVAAFAAGGCGTDGAAGTDGTNGSNGANSLIQNSTEPAGTNCPYGGTKLEIGLDTDGNGMLTGAEIQKTLYVCNGSPGTSGLRSLLAITAEPAGANCANGGQKLDYGVDDNANGTLDADEIDGTSYACNGDDGASTLLATTPEAPGANCAYGGTKVTSGADDNSNGTLEAGEIDATAYVCNAPVSGILYLSQDGNTNGLYKLSTTNAAAALVGASGVTSSTVGLTYDPSTGVLLGSKWQTLLAISTNGSGATDRGGTGTEGLSYDYVNNVLYGTINGQFFTMNKTNGAVITNLAGPGFDAEGLAFRADTRTLYAIGQSTNLYAYSIATNTWTVVGNTGQNFALGDIAYDPWTKTLYATGGSNGNLYKINPTTAAATLIGNTGLPSANGGLEYVPAYYP